MPAADNRVSIPLIIFCVATKAIIFVFAAENYGYLSDELYFLDASYHLELGYVDFPPVIAWLIGAIRVIFGESLWILRLAALLIGVTTALLAIDLCRIIGGGSVARWITAMIVLFAPGVLSVQSLLTMNVLDQLWWMLSFWLLFSYLDSRQPRLMLMLGGVIGIAIMTKLSILAFCAGCLIAAIIWQRDLFQRREVWLAIAIALLITSPFIFWQIQNDFPFADFLAAYNVTPPAAIVLQNPILGLFITMNPLFALVWAPGAFAILLSENRALRFLGTASWLSLAVFVAASVKFYFAVPVMMLFSIYGATVWERILGRTINVRSTTAILIVFVSGVISVPIAAPVLPGELLQQIADYLRDAEAEKSITEPAALDRYFPHYAEMHGWPELVTRVTDIYEQLEPSTRADAVLVAGHYGQAAALNRLDHGDRIPDAVSGHMSYHLWNADVELGAGLYVGFEEEELTPLFDSVELKGKLDCQRCIGRERGLKVFLVGEPRVSGDEIRARIRRYYFY